MIISAKNLAKYFRDTVSFDFKKETISSYTQIRRRYDDFYALENTQAFSALLKDVIGHNDQLMDVFIDLNAAGCGFECFAEKANQDNPHRVLSSFLLQPRYGYYKDEIGRVYLAINTWLCFFGANEMNAQWDFCPICGSPVAAGACTGKGCKKKQEDFLPIMLELQSILSDEKREIPTSTPKYYKTITESAQFGTYKKQIDEMREQRKSRENAATDAKMKKALAAGIAELKKIKESLRIESAKENPDFDAILNELNGSSAVLEVLKYGDKSFKTDVDLITDSIIRQKDAAVLKRETEANKTDAEAYYKEFIAAKTDIDGELANSSSRVTTDEMKKKIADADKKHASVSSMNSKYPDIYSTAQKGVISAYEDVTRPAILEKLRRVAHIVRLDAAKDKLVFILGEIKKQYEICLRQKNGTKELFDRFVREVEQDAEFIECRKHSAWESGVYQKEATPIRGKIVALLDTEVSEKKAALELKCTPLFDKLRRSKPKHKASTELWVGLNQIKSDKYFDSIKASAEYKRKITDLENGIYKLSTSEKRYFKIKWRAILISSISLFVTAVTLYSLFAFFIPLFGLDFKADKVADGTYEAVAQKGSGDVIEITDYLPHYFLQKTKRVTAIAAEAFKDSTSFKKCIIPAGIERIGAKAFSGCENLRTVVLLSTVPPKVESDSFDKHTAAILVPAEAYETYLHNSSWAAYTDTLFPYYENEDTHGMVTFDSMGGSAVENITGVKLDSVCGALAVPQKAGYTFDGWYYLAQGGKEKKIDSTAPVFERSTKLYAKWSLGKYAVSFYTFEGDTPPTPQTFTFGDNWYNLPSAERAGYTFAGWYLDGKRIETGAIVDITCDVTLSAAWTPLEYIITFNSSSGSAVNAVTRTFDADYGVLPVPTRKGYVFGGWKNGNTLVSADTKVTVAKNHTLTATWTPITYTVKYELGGGNVVGESTIVCKYDDSMNLATPTRTGYTFAYWDCGGKKYDVGKLIYNLSDVPAEFVFTAHWTPISYTLVYDPSGGTVSNSTEDCTYGVDTVAKTPSRAGYTLLYWAHGEEHIAAGATISNLTAIDGETVTLKAVWRPNKYTLTYDTRGGSQAHTSVECSYGTPFVLETPTRVGYTFGGWIILGDTYTAGQTIEQALTLDDGASVTATAVWHALENTLIFDKNLGTGAMDSMRVGSDTSIDLPASTFTRVGYTFAGWSTSADGAVEYSDGASFTMSTSESVTLYAIWTPNLNTLHIFAGNGTEDKLEFSYRSDERFLLPENAFAYTGYTFGGWVTPKNTGSVYMPGDEYTMPTDGYLYFIAKWIPVENTVVFDAGGADGTMESQTIATAQTKKLNECLFEKRGYRFIGWSDVSGGEVKYLDGANYTMDASAVTTLYAVWQRIDYEIVYDLDGGENHVSNKTDYNVDSETLVLADPTKPGYTFDGWYSDPLKAHRVTEITTEILGDVHLYAKWSVNSNTLSFNANDGDGEMDPISAATGGTLNLPECQFTRDGYEFLGWSTSETGGVYYQNEDDYVMGTAASYTLYAVWGRVIYDVEYRLGGGVNGDNPDSYHVESPDILLKDPTREGYDFGGWYTDSTMTTEQVEAIVKGSHGNITLYAKWTAKVNTLTLDANGGVGEDVVISLRTGHITTLPQLTFTRVGYNFAGWSHTFDGSSVYGDRSSFTMGTDDVTLYAIWTEFAYSVVYNLNGGTNHSQNPSGYTGGATIALQAATRPGYTFGGWYSDAQFEHAYSEITPTSTGNIVLYAKWTPNENSIILEPNGASGSKTEIKLHTDESIALPALPFTRAGYTFAGWATSEGGDVVYADRDKYVMGTAPTYTLYAIWTPNVNKIIFNSNGGKGSMANQYIETDAASKLTKNAFTRAGYTFVGWATSSGGAVVYGDTASYKMGTGASYTLYAKWTPNVNTLTFDANGGSGTMDQIKMTTASTVSLPANAFTREGHRFLGWSTSAGGSVVYENTVEYTMGTSSSYTLYAVWETLEYTVTVSRNNANVKLTVDGVEHDNKESVKVRYGAKIVITFSSVFSNVASLSCTFDGSEISSGAEKTMPAHDVTVSASSTEKIVESGGGGTGSCLPEGTLIALAGGRYERIENIKVGDRILSFDHTTGALVEVEVGFVFKAYGTVSAAKLGFSDGSELTVVNVNGHGMLDATLGKYVLVTPDNVDFFVGHSFVIIDENGEAQTVQLTSYEITEDTVNRYDVVTAENLNCIANGFVTCSDVLVNVCNTFVLTEEFVYDLESMAADIEKYGLYTYSEWERYMTEAEFEAFGGAYFKVAVGKGLVSENDILVLLWFLNSWS